MPKNVSGAEILAAAIIGRELAPLAALIVRCALDAISDVPPLILLIFCVCVFKATH